MLSVTNISVTNIDNAVRGARNPMNSWAKSDSKFDDNGKFIIGPNDLKLLYNLSLAGPSHRKYLRQIFVSMDITAPLYWWKEMDTYKVSTTANSTSTMHKIQSFKLDESLFSTDHLLTGSKCKSSFVMQNVPHTTGDKKIDPKSMFKLYLDYIEQLRVEYNKYSKTDPKYAKKIWYTLIQMLPSSFNQMRTWTASYETLYDMYDTRRGHKLEEWKTFLTVIDELPYTKELIIDPIIKIDEMRTSNMK